MSEEKLRLNRIGANSTYSVGINGEMTKQAYSVIKGKLVEPILEYGPAEGLMTELMVSDGLKPDLVEGSNILVEELRKKYPDLIISESLFENFEFKKKYRTMVMGHVLEHVENPLAILTNAIKYLETGGTIIAMVPNALSIHRQAAVEMGLLKSVYELNEADLRHGHRRVFDPSMLQTLFKDCGFQEITLSGYWLKPLANSQIEAIYSKEMIEAFVKLGMKYPEIAGEILITGKLV